MARAVTPRLHDTPRRLLRAVGFAVATVYGLWNVWWLAQGRPAPSLFTGLTGLPCPTTGGTRSFLALCDGNLAGSLYYNPMTVPILLLLAATLGWLAMRHIRAKHVSLPTFFLHAWAAVLLIAWIIKFASPSDTW